jgi:effector-binding domain-containing protein
MKLAKYITLLFLLFLLAFVVFVATQPATYQITKTKKIALPVGKVFDYVNDFENWTTWQQFEKDDDVNYNFSKNTIGENSSVKWNDDYSIKTTFAYKDSIAQEYISGSNKQTLHWKFEKDKNGTFAKVTLVGGLTFREKISSVLYGGITSYVGPQLEESLGKLQNYLINELGNFSVKVFGIVNKPEINYLEQKDSCTIKDFPKKSKQLLATIKRFTSNNEIVTLGKPFVVFFGEPTSNKVKYAMCVPVKEEVFTTPESQIQGRTYKNFIAVRAKLKGDYTHLKNAWGEARKYITENKILEDRNGLYTGIYNVSPPEEIAPSKWDTDIFIPLQKKKPKLRKVVRDSTATISTNTNTQEEIPSDRPSPFE